MLPTFSIAHDVAKYFAINALIIVAVIPLALRGVRYRALGAVAVLQRNVLIYGGGGIIAPFVGIKLIDLALVALHLA